MFSKDQNCLPSPSRSEGGGMLYLKETELIGGKPDLQHSAHFVDQSVGL